MSKGNKQYVTKAATYGPPLLLAVAAILYGGLGKPIFDNFGMRTGGYAVLLYALISVVFCVWSIFKLRGALRLVAIICATLLLLFGLWGYVAVWFSA